MNPLIIGSGPNGLSAAFYLAKAGLKPVVFERSDQVGGGAVTGEVAPGFRCPTLSHEVLLHEQVARDMQLKEHGLEWLTSDVDVCAPSLDGAPVVLYRDAVRPAAHLQGGHAGDAAAAASGRRAAQDVRTGRVADYRRRRVDVAR